MNAELLLDHFNRVSDARDALPRLRRFVLDLAVRGKLVEQDPRDESASSLVQRIRREKLRAIKSGDERKEKPLFPLGEDERPFPIPFEWSWSQLAEIGFLNPRNTADDKTPASFVPMSMISAEYGVAHTDEVRPWGEIKSGFTHFADGDVGLAKITPCYENRKSTVFRNLRSGIGAGTTELHVIRPVFVSADYVLIFLKSPYFIESGIPRMTGTAGQKRLPTEHFAYSPFPLPPLAEQRRIVKKVDELLALCDRLETAQCERESFRNLLAASAHHHLNSGANIAALRKQGQFFIGHLPRLTARPDHVKLLRKTILSLAVRGKLVSQSLSDEPASEQLRRINLEKLRLIKEKQIRMQKPLPPITEKDTPFPLPDSWVWCRLGDICFVITDGAHHTPHYVGTGVPFLSVKDVSSGVINFSNTRFISEAAHWELCKRCHPEVGDVLLTKVGTTGIAVTIDQEREFSIFVSLALLKFSQTNLDRNYLCLLINSPFVKKQSEENTQGIGNKNLVLRLINQFSIPIPPLAEQHRIVAKVHELMALCDQLETRLTTAQTEASHLLESVLHNALNGSAEQQLSHSSK
jgi:type I restriction enzyme S subunit